MNRLFAVLGIAVVCITLPSCSKSSSTTVEAATESVVAPVIVARVERHNLSRQLTVAAAFRPYQEIEVHAKVAGYVKNIRVDVGDRVRSGELLATLEIPEMAGELAQAAATSKRARAEVVRASGELQRAKSAHEVAHLIYQRLAAVMKSRPNLIAQQEIDDAQAKDRVAEAQVDTARAALSAAQEAVQVSDAAQSRVKAMSDYSRITAPFAGVITQRYADTGAMIQAGTASQTQAMPLVRLSEDNLLRLTLPVPESVVARIHVGDPVDVHVLALNRNFTGRISRFASRLQDSTRTMETEVDVPNPQRVLICGMYAEATLILDRVEGRLAVPVQALSRQDNGARVFVVDSNNRVRPRRIQLGMETPDQVEVLSGLKEDELVVVSGAKSLEAGQAVAPKLAQVASVKEGF
ncbi:MAG: efflux RND transporter periplasmic adaptor subunit [Bryobacterales bacterium]|nr:efflux RND transporter periplasmic adaptor subunit [Bryobacterales bacterium]